MMLRSLLFICMVFFAAVPTSWADVCTAGDPSCFESEGGLSLLQTKAKMITTEPNTESVCIFQEASALAAPFLNCCSAGTLTEQITCAIDISATVCGEKYGKQLYFEINQCARDLVRNVVQPPYGKSLIPVKFGYLLDTIDEPEVAYINIIRHGEKCAPLEVNWEGEVKVNKTAGHSNLTGAGSARSKYLTRCMSKNAPSLALPFGKPTSVMCHDVNVCGPHGAATIWPLAEALNLTIGASIWKHRDGQNVTEDKNKSRSKIPIKIVDGFNKTIHHYGNKANFTHRDIDRAESIALKMVPDCGEPLAHSNYSSLTPAEILAHDYSQLDCVIDNARSRLTNQGTLIFQIVYQTAPEVLSRMGIPNLPEEYHMWPLDCPNPKWAEPACEATDVNLWHGWNDTEFPYEPASMCFDVIWQVKHTRPNLISPWKPVSIKSLYEGFEGDANGPCEGDLKGI